MEPALEAAARFFESLRSARRALKAALYELRSSLIPVTCLVCDGPVSSGIRTVCRTCALAIPWWRRADGCPRCGMPVDPQRAQSEATWGVGRLVVAGCPACLAEGSPLHVCLAATRYAGLLPTLIPAFKNPRSPFGPRPQVWSLVDRLADELADRMIRETGSAPDLVVPVPLHASRRRRRGFNQADLIAHRIARRLERPFDPGLLERIRDTGTQAGLTARERRQNLVGAFHVRRSLEATRPRIALIDDVLTTGSTLEASANALLAAGAGEVVALTLSATVAPRRARSKTGAYAPPPHHPRSLEMRASRHLVSTALAAAVLCLASVSALQAAAEDAKPDAAFRAAMKRFLVSQNIPAQMGEQMTYSAAEQVLGSLASTGVTITEPMQAIVVEEARKDFGQKFGDVEFLTDLYSAIYVKHFTAKEISDIASFWESPVAKKLLAQTTTLNDAFVSKMQESTTPLTEAFQARLDKRLREEGILGKTP